MILSERLTAIRDMAPAVGVTADIGSDHALLPIALLAAGKCQRAIAADISDAALDKARRYIARYGAKNMELRVGDGLSVLSPGEAELITVAGMGGELTADILLRGREKLCKAAVLIAPNNGWAEARRCLAKLGYAITAERMLYENRRFYQLMLALPGHMELDAFTAEFGWFDRSSPVAELLAKKRLSDAVTMLATARRGNGERAQAAAEEAKRLIAHYGEVIEWLSK